MAGFFSRLKRSIGQPAVEEPPASAVEGEPSGGAAEIFHYGSGPSTPDPVASLKQPSAEQESLGEVFSSLPTTAAALERLGEVWRVERFLHEFQPLVIAELRECDEAGNGSGEIAYWFFDQEGHFVCNTPETLPPHLLARTRETMLSTLVAREDQSAFYRRLVALLSTIQRPFRLRLLQRLFAASPLPILTALGYGPGQDARFRVVDATGGVSIIIDDDLEWPITLERVVAPPFLSGWHATDVLTCFAPLLMIELRNDSGGRSTWVLNDALERIDGEDLVNAETIAVLRRVAPPMFRRHWQQVVAVADARPDYVPLPMLRLNGAALHRMLHRVRDLVMPETVDQMITTPLADIVLGAAPTYPNGLVLAAEHVRTATSHSLYQAGRDAVRRRRFTWPSPVDGSEAELEAVIAPQEYTIVYQFLDRNGLRFMVAVGERDCVQIGLYLPYENRFLCGVRPANWWFRHSIPTEFWMLVYEHCLFNLPSFSGRKRAATVEIVNVFMALPLLHIGHYVWNDLSGQAKLARELGADAPRSFIIDAPDGQAEFFGRLETLFPVLRDRIDRSLPDKKAFSDLVYSSDIVPIRFTSSYIDADLRSVVRRYVTGTQDYAQVAEQRSRHPGALVLVVGVRLEDRTFVDPAEAYRALIDHLDRYRPGTIIVLDGRNCRPGGKQGEFFASIKDTHATRSPLEVELELVQQLQDYAVGTSIVVASTIGLSVETSMAWCYLADACLSPWGAGLAKYRWLANLPSVIPTSRYNLLHRSDLDIYHSEQWMESPTLLLLPDPDKVTDYADRFGNAPSASDHVGRECFEVDLPHLFDMLEQLLSRHDSQPVAAYETTTTQEA